MLTKVKSDAAVAVIKWTEDEWKQIAAHLYSTKGPDVLLSDHLDKIKARDVFDAQMATLPTQRHRKLISMAQGFQTVRDRLRMLFNDLAHARQNDLFAAKQPRRTLPSVAEKGPDLFNMPVPELADTIKVAAAAPETPAAPAEPLAATPGEAVMASMSPMPPAVAVAPRMQTPAARPLQDAPSADNSDMDELVRLARPFVAMVCEEFSRALVSELSKKESAGVLGMLAQSGLLPKLNVAAADRPVRAGTEEETSDDVVDYAAEPQPLFDPKLPPSANSDFKPVIGLVGASDSQAVELQAQYPQLQLIAVRADAVRQGQVFQRCQRIIGMQDEIPAPTDEFLGKSLRHRYVRITGGIDRVGDQLSLWLNKPGALNARPGKPMHRNGKRPGGLYPKRLNNRRQS